MIDYVLSMSTINFLKRFSNMTIANVSDANNNQKQTKNNKNNKTETATETVSDNVRFMHGKNVVMTCGQYKGYAGYIYDETSCRVELEIEVDKFVFSNGCYNGSSDIAVNNACEVIVGKVPILYGVMLGNMEVRLPQDYYLHVMVVMVDNVRKLGKFVGSSLDECNKITYELQMFDLAYDKTKSTVELLDELSRRIVAKSDIFETAKRVFCDIVCDNDHYIVTRDQYTGKYGRLSRVIGEQYIVRTKQLVIVNKNFVIIRKQNAKNTQVDIIRGEYRGKTARLVKVIEPTFTVQIDAIGKKIHSHLLCKENNYIVKPITRDDIYYIDLLLHNDNYFSVTKVTCAQSDSIECQRKFVYVGLERSKNGAVYRESSITDVDVKQTMPGFRLYDPKYITKGETNTDETVEQTDQDHDEQTEVNAETEVNIDVEDYDEENENTTGDYNENPEDQFSETNEREIVYDNTEGEAKATFRDTERSGYVNSDITVEDKRLIKRIEKCASIMGSACSDIFQLLARVNEIVKRLKSELEGSGMLGWGETDTNYIIVYVLIVDHIRSGYNTTDTMYNEYITSLYKNKFFTKTGINNTVFLGSKDIPFLQVIKMTADDQKRTKELYKSGRYTEIVTQIMNNCLRVMETWYNPIQFSTVQTQYITVAKRQEYPKYFLTTRDILENNECSTATKMLWGPTTHKYMKRWLDMVSANCEREQDEFKKSIYQYVIDNFERAPFVLKQLQNSDAELDKIRYAQLHKTFTTFMKKLQVYRQSIEGERQRTLKTVLENKSQIIKRRSQFDSSKTNTEYTEVLKTMDDLAITKRVRVV